jgi:SP family facilitated glucose transporter-like MFS transporter 3
MLFSCCFMFFCFSIVLQFAQQLSGINAVFYYSTSFFTGVLTSPVLGTLLVTSVNVLATYAALKLMDKSSRRLLILTSSAGMAASALIIVVVLISSNTSLNWIALLAVMSFVSFFEIGLGPIPWLIVAEMFDSKYVATGYFHIFYP